MPISAAKDEDGNYLVFNQDQKNNWYVFEFDQRGVFQKVKNIL